MLPDLIRSTSKENTSQVELERAQAKNPELKQMLQARSHNLGVTAVAVSLPGSGSPKAEAQAAQAAKDKLAQAAQDFLDSTNFVWRALLYSASHLTADWEEDGNKIPKPAAFDDAKGAKKSLFGPSAGAAGGSCFQHELSSNVSPC